PVHIEGTTLEGGGQILRLAIGLSALTRIPIHITNIRGNRYRGGGLKVQHMKGVEWLARAAEAQVTGLALKSKELLFVPRAMSKLALDANDANGPVWDVRQTTPGATNLVFQALLPYVLFARTPHERITLRITGGTNISASPSFDYVEQVLLPVLEKIGVPRIKARLKERGWAHVGAGTKMELGCVEYEITPLRGTLPGFRLAERGEVVHLTATFLAPKACESQCRQVLETVVWKHRKKIFEEREVEWEQDVEVRFEDSGHSRRYYLLLVATTSTGMKLGRDWLHDGRAVKAGREETTIKMMVEKATKELISEVAKGGCVDKYLRDQLVVFQALAEGRSEVFAGDEGSGKGEEDLHARTAQWVASRVLGVDFDEGGGCDGVGFV
ncbi:RNA 3'-terminal phosphate cyclase, partial [Westerdykella ornata]